MGKSPAKWIKTVLFGKKSSKSNLSKDPTLDKKTSITSKAHSNDFGDDSMVISSPVPTVMHTFGERKELEKTSGANLMRDTLEVVRSTMGLDTANEDELIRLEQAATKAQAAFRGYLARRAFWALKGIIRLQALVRGHLVRRQAVATLSCMRAIVEFQALARGRKVRLSSNNRQVLQKYTPEEVKDKKRADLLGTSLRSEKLSKNAFGTKLVASSHTIMPLSIQYDPVDPNSARNWLERWSSSHFWDPLPRSKKTKPKRKPTKPQPEEIETGRPKRSLRKVPTTNLDNNLFNSSENEKPKRPIRKASTHQAEPAQEQSHSELEKVKQSLRKISVSTASASEMSKLNDLNDEKVNDLNDIVVKQPEHETLPVPPIDDNPNDILQDDPPNLELNGNKYSSSKENMKTRRRKSFPSKQENPESASQNTPTLPSYMAATESAKAKLRAQAAAKAAEDGAENGFVRRHSLPSSTGKPSLQSPRVQKPLQANGKGWSKSNKSQISPRDDKTLQTGWKR